MTSKGVFKFLLITISIITILNCSYADAGPEIGPNQAKIISHDYIIMHNLHYTAVTPNWNAWSFYVKDTKTEEKKWLSADIVIPDDPMFGGPGRYKLTQSGLNNTKGVWIVQVNDKSGQNAGQIYVDAETGKVLNITIAPQKSHNDSSVKPMKATNLTNINSPTNTNQTFPESDSQPKHSTSNNGLFGLIAIIIATSIGYFMYTRV